MDICVYTHAQTNGPKSTLEKSFSTIDGVIKAVHPPPKREKERKKKKGWFCDGNKKVTE